MLRPRRLTKPLQVAGLACLLSGCSLLPAKKQAALPVAPAASDDYTLVFPDVVDLHVADRPDCPAQLTVGPDGRIDLGPYGPVFAEGATAAELTARVARAVGVSDDAVRCQVAVARSRVVQLVGSGMSEPRTVSFHGAERVTELLKRAGGIPEDGSTVRVVRRNVARGTATETFIVDLAAIRHGDLRTDCVLEANDEVRVEENRGVTLVGFVGQRVRP